MIDGRFLNMESLCSVTISESCLISGHTLLGQLVEVSPNDVSQEIDPLRCLFFKHLPGKLSAHLHGSCTFYPSSVCLRVPPHRPWCAPSAIHLEPFLTRTNSAGTSCLKKKNSTACTQVVVCCRAQQSPHLVLFWGCFHGKPTCFFRILFCLLCFGAELKDVERTCEATNWPSIRWYATCLSGADM